jgi:DNA repair exonuclease SbcCD nuclease subunit
MIIPLMKWWKELFNFCPVVVIPGQHDLPNHRLSEWKEGVLGSLATLDRVKVLIDPYVPFITESYCIYGFPWGVDIISPEGLSRNNRMRVAMVHTLAYDGKKPYPGAPETGNVKQLSEKFAWADLVVSGDNHQTFTYQSPNHLWVNPGSFLRTSAKQIDHAPTVFLWEGQHKGNTGISLPANPSAVTREHIESERGDERIEAFVSSIQQDKNTQHLSFKDAVRARLEHPSVSNGVRTWAEKALNAQGDNNGH